MRHVALISQTLRAGYCHAFVDRSEPTWTILTPDPSVFAGFEWAVAPRILAAAPPPGLIRPTRLWGNRIFRAVLNRARSGSRFGAWAERRIKAGVRRLRGARLPVERSRSSQHEVDSRSMRASSMFARLVEEHRSAPIDRIVVFDLFDLPVALTFADDHGVEVLVR